METLTVSSLMSSPPFTISPRTRLPQIKSLMRINKIRRLPVLDQGRLVGIVTLGDVRNAFPSDASMLSIYELSYLVDRVTARDVMRTSVVTVSSTASVIDAARLMLQHKIGGLPVVENDTVVGMITESDIFRAVITGQIVLAMGDVADPPQPSLLGA
jgi:CBS domain-containing protein